MRKFIATALAAVMALSVASPLAEAAPAEEQLSAASAAQVEAPAPATPEDAVAPTDAAAPAENEILTEGEVSAAEEDAVAEVAALFEALPAAGEVAAMSQEERQAVMDRAAEALNAYDALTPEQAETFRQQYAALYTAVTEELVAALMGDQGGAETLSLQPMEETTGLYLTLVDYTEEQLTNFPVDQLLQMLTDEMGNPVTVESGYNGAWIFVQGLAGQNREQYYTFGTGDTVDLWTYSSFGITSEDNCTIWIVLGDGTQLDDSRNHRYIVNASLINSQNMFGSFDYYLKDATGLQNICGYSGKSFGSNYSGNVNDQAALEALGVEGMVYDCFVPAQNAQNTYKLVLDAGERNRLLRAGIRTEVYPAANYVAYRDEGAALTGAITDEIFGDGYTSTFATQISPDNYRQADNLWCVVFTDAENGRMIGCVSMGVHVQTIQGDMSGQIFSWENGQMNLLKQQDWQQDCWGLLELTIDPAQTATGVEIGGRNWREMLTFMLPEDVPTEGPYYFTLPDNGLIKAVYKGPYVDIAEAEAYGTDITDQVLCDGTETAPYGYLTGFHDTFLTIVLYDGSVVGLDLYTRHASDSSYYYNNLSFEITDVSLPGQSLSRYIPRAISGVELDTYYRTDDKYDVGGYQLVLIKDKLTAEQLRQLVPSFYAQDGVTVSSGGRLISGQTNLENAQWSTELPDTVAIQVSQPDLGVKNYQVTFKTLQDEGTLFVAGPDERFVNLTADNDYIHDILVANIGQTDLTGVTVELIDPVNVRLDSYWTMNNSTLSAFTETYPAYETSDESGQTTTQVNAYATPANIGKIRLLPAGNGTISGTLRITTADGQQRDIKLTGIAANPQITSGQLADAVKYVPYSYMIATDNMYKGNKTSFHLVEGTLPAGIQLIESTGELYGTPLETGDFTFTVRADYTSNLFVSSQATFTLHVSDNTNEMVYNQSDMGYAIKVPLGVEQGDGTYDFYVEDPTVDQLYVSYGEYNEFVDVWLNGQRLVRGVDYTSESGSTRITIKSQTFATKVIADGYNTIAAEFRVDGDRTKEMKRTAQNFRVNGSLLGGGSGSSGSSSDNSSAAQTNTAQNAAGSGSTTANGQSGTAGAAGQAPANATGVTLRFSVVDGNGSPVVGATAELHSTPRYGTTDGNGCVVFSNVEFGSHTLTIYDASGNRMASKSFTVAYGGFGVNGSVITVSDGALVDVTVKVDNGALSLETVTLPQDQAAIPQTGDDFAPAVWMVLALLALSAAAGLTVYKRKKEQG